MIHSLWSFKISILTSYNLMVQKLWIFHRIRIGIETFLNIFWHFCSKMKFLNHKIQSEISIWMLFVLFFLYFWHCQFAPFSDILEWEIYGRYQNADFVFKKCGLLLFKIARTNELNISLFSLIFLFEARIHGPRAVGSGPDQYRTNFRNHGPVRTRNEKILEIPDQLGPGPGKFKK